MFIYQIAGWLLACVLSAICYRAGGMAKNPDTEPKWIPMWMRQSWVRDWLCPLFSYGSLLLFWQPDIWYGWILLAIAYGLLGGALSTYWDFLFGFDNFWFSGFVCGLAAFPLIFCGLDWWIVLIRAILLAILWGGWCAWQTNDVREEMGRGAFLII